MEEQKALDIHIVTHPVRYDISTMLLEAPGLFFSDIIQKLGHERRVTVYHLRYLERYGFIKTELKETGKKTPLSERFATPTEKLYNMKKLLSILA